MFEMEAVHCQGWVKKSHPCPPSDKGLPSTPGFSSLFNQPFAKNMFLKLSFMQYNMFMFHLIKYISNSKLGFLLCL